MSPRPDSPDAPLPAVSAEEGLLLTLTQGLLTGAARDALLPLLSERPAGPASPLGPAAAALLRDALAKGSVRALARLGGWRRGQCLHGEEVRSGRLWERHPLVPLAFTDACPALLQWLAARPPTPLAEGPRTPADALLWLLALQALHPSPAAAALAAQPAARTCALAWLGAPDVLTAASPAPPPLPLDFAPLLAGDGALLEALQPALAWRWLQLSQAPGTAAPPAAEAEARAARWEAAEGVLQAFLTAADGAGRRDLASFVVDAAVASLARPAAPPPLDAALPLALRGRLLRASGLLLRALGRLEAWRGQHRRVGFVDDGYAAAQFLLARHVALDARAAAEAASRLEALERLDTLDPRGAPAP
jgi:hypothetical protein